MYVTPRYRFHYEQQSYEPFTARLLNSLLPRAQLFMDIGASYGFYSMLVASRNSAVEIMALEPTPTTFAVLQRNLGLLDNSNNISMHQLAVSDCIGRRKFKVTFASDSCGFFDHPNVGTLEIIEVDTVTIDAVLKDRAPCPLVIKIDTEGNELAVLRGMAETLARFPDVKLIVEFNPATLRAANVEPDALLEYLDRLGFQVFFIDEEQAKLNQATVDDAWSPKTPNDYVNLYCVR